MLQKQILRQIRRKFEEIAPKVQTQIEKLSLEKLDILGDEIFDLATMVDLENWLAHSTTKMAKYGEISLLS